MSNGSTPPAFVPLDPVQQRSWDEHGFVVVRNFADRSMCDRLYRSAVELARNTSEAESAGCPIVPEGHPKADASEPEDFVAKIFKLHRRPPFDEFPSNERLLGMVASILGADADLFLSQFIFKSPSAYGQPWHQDSFYFPFSESHQLGAWLAVTRATRENGCLWVVPGSQNDPIHEHVPDERPSATRAYTRIVGRDTSDAVAMEMGPGDLLLFDSHVLHSSTDNESDEVRASYVCHFSRAGVVDNTDPERSVNDWAPALRAGAPVSASAQ